ncbi:cardiolipin synthase [Enterococcus asini]|uniref:cardiolipin synthase n=3 Tax=Enterococcus TaxID=1350 RepID=UPI00288E927B|nr:cardiolipin synthase [Enterococcus asini]MDT2757012.1 cardiolipin synthase [Enterococcus asini]
MGIEMEMSMLSTVLSLLIFINTIGAIITVFRRPRSITSILAWLVTLTFLPVIGFIIYLFCGRGIDGETVYRFDNEDQKRIGEINSLIHQNNQDYHRSVNTTGSKLLERYLRNVEESPLAKGNSVDLFTDGREKFDALFADIKKATDHVHVEYYAFFPDRIGTAFLEVLTKKAKEGVEIRLIYDPWGAKGSSDAFFAPLIEAGGQVTAFITSRDLIRKTRLNYHLHRKIVVIDGQIGWTGGFNVGDQYLGEFERFGYWRDTHARFVGTASFSLQEIFLKDWNASVRKKGNQLNYEDRYFVIPEGEVGDVAIQVVSDGPENKVDILKSAFVKMLLAAQDKVWIQTPYLIPDDTMISALLIAAQSGVDVRIMIPSMPDHPFIYRATQYYSNLLHQYGIKIYQYQKDGKGFLHAKTLVMDDIICSVGSTNQDIRSYSLNFEVSAFIYDEETTLEMQRIFERDMKDCFLLTDEIIAKQSRWLRFKQNFSRLLSPIL